MSSVTGLPRGIERDQRLARVAAARARPRERRGRAWINGREIGGPEPRIAHLTLSYD